MSATMTIEGPATRRASDGAAAPSQARPRIVVIDDEPASCSTLRDLFESRYAVEVISQPTGALDRALAGKPDVVILDVDMPGLGGLDSLAHLRNVAPAVPVIVFTGPAATQDYAGGSMARGALAYVPKPTKTEYLDHFVTVAIQLFERPN